MTTVFRASWSAALLFLGLLAGAVRAAEQEIDFNRDIRPILSESCFECHGPDVHARKAGLRLDTRDGAAAILESGQPAIKPGDPRGGSLIDRVTTDDPDDRMPPEKAGKTKLSPEQVAKLREWIERGAEYQPHWSFIAPKRQVSKKGVEPRSGWVRNPIDRFVLARLEREGLGPSAEASRETLIRRVSLDLTGLPPSPEDVEAFLNDPSPDAYEKVVDRLLDSPRYGEHLASHWLDAARYADTNGYNNDEERQMWRWRDWVIDAYNTNLPYDRFITEQVAGDLLPNPTTGQRIATAFNRNHNLTTEGGIIEEEYRAEYVADRVHTATTVFLGLSMQCARCHDHKFDPITQKDYYRFAAYFSQAPDRVAPPGTTRAEPFLTFPTPSQQTELAAIEKRRAELPAAIKAAEPAGGEPLAKLKEELAAADSRKAELDKAVESVMVMGDMPTPRKVFVLTRGEYDKPGEEVTPGVPASLPSPPEGAPPNRLGLARWLTDASNPLVARVAVNQWWRSCFGDGLVETVEDFGAQGGWPSHPELLDWLATELVRTGWDVKAMHRLIVTSAAYRQDSAITPALLDRDPRNRLLARGPRFRLSAEAVRDGALAASGLLVEKIGGPSVKPYQPEGLWEDVTVNRAGKYVPDTGEGLYRRTLYTFWKRTCPPPSLATFDGTTRETCVMRRARTNTPLQALVLLNDPTFVEAARKLAERMIREGGRTPPARLERGVRLAIARPPTDVERRELLAFYEEARRRFAGNPSEAAALLEVGSSPRDGGIDPADLAAWTSVASLILNTDAAVTKD